MSQSRKDRKLESDLRFYDSSLRLKREGGMGVVYTIKSHFPRIESSILYLTDNWNVTGTPVDWTVGAIKNRLREIDQAQQGVTLEQLKSRSESLKESRHRTFVSNTEAMLSDMRSSFAKATNDINTSTLEKIDKRRIDDGYRK